MCLSSITKVEVVKKSAPLKAYKVFYVRGAGLYSVHRSRDHQYVPGKAYEALRNLRFTLSGKKYRVGFHAFKTRGTTEKYLRECEERFGRGHFVVREVLLWGQVHTGRHYVGEGSAVGVSARYMKIV